jgi:signal transduction histidine kinase/HPt (histidine-containing phosphotransfer) domain-containing protein/FixJ family two-component response regulator
VKLSLRRLVAILLGTFGVLIAALLTLATLQLRGLERANVAENLRTESVRIADSMRQSSDDLTEMVRLFVSTGDRRFRDYYNRILAIRAGSAPRPADYDNYYWDRVLAGLETVTNRGPRESLTAEMRAAHFRADEFASLQASLAASNRLAVTEVAVMREAARGQRARAYARLVDASYLRQKGTIMGAVARFVRLVDARTTREVNSERSQNDALFAAEIAVLGLIVLLGLVAVVVLRRYALRPLDALIAVTRRIAGGAYGHRAQVGGVSEFGHLADAFNEMGAAIQSDIAARQAAELGAVEARAVAEHANRAKSTFLAGMSHEIRTPMIGVTGMLEVLARTDLTDQQHRLLATAESSAHTLLQIIGDILDFSKIEAEKLELAPATFDLRAIVSATVDGFRLPASAKGLLLTSTIDERIGPAYVGDPLRIRQILSNFLSNAVKFTQVGGVEMTLRVLEARHETQTIELAVTDTGIGISVEQQQRLFTDYNQAAGDTTRRFGGTGLGLAISRRLSELMGGQVTMTSQVGKGTTLRLTVPLPLGDEADLEAFAGTDGKHPVTRLKPSRGEAIREGSLLLVAEDHPVNRTVLAHQLDVIGFHADFCEDGQAALERFLGGGYAFVITDLHMPRLDGYGLTAEIRRHEREAGAVRVPIMALSANVMHDEPERCLTAGMDDFAAKPTTIPFLAGKLRQWLPHLSWPQEESTDRACAVARSAPADGIFDPAVLEDLTAGDSALIAAVLDDFIATTRTDLESLDAAIAAHDGEETRRRAHRLKGASRIVGAHRLSGLAQQIDDAAADGTDGWTAVAALAEELRATFAGATAAEA